MLCQAADTASWDSQTERGQGTVVTWEGDATACTHVICRHREQACCAWALRHGKKAVTAFWVWDSASESRHMPLEDPVSSRNTSTLIVVHFKRTL